MKELVYPRLLLPAVERYAGKVGFHDGERHLTYEEHGRRVLSLAHALRHQLGVGPEDRVAVMAANSQSYLEIYHAGFLGGGVVNPLNLRLAGKELQYILADSGTEVVFVDSLFADHFLKNIADARDELPVRTIVLIGEEDVGHDVAYEDLVASGEPTLLPEPDEEDPAILMYTGGTTGRPKGVLLDQRAELLNLYHIAAALGLHDSRVYLHQTPLFHAASMAAVLGLPASGGTSVFMPLFEPGAVLGLMERYGVNWTTMVPTMIAMLLDHPDFRSERVAGLHDLVYGASPMSSGLLSRLQAALPDTNIWQGYGMTESSSVLTFLTDEDHRAGGERLRSAGRPVMGVTVSIQDAEGNVLPIGEEGEVCARGGNFMREYWGLPEATADAFRGDWYHTGDAGRLDEEGYLYLVDRVKDMIVTGGENVYSIEVENAISTHPDVDQVAVIGIPHETWGEQVHAIVVPRAEANLSERDVQDHARRSIAGYKVPKSVEFRAEPLPLSGAMKPLKRELRRPYWEGHEQPGR